jgi:hypothetical protein
MLEGLKDSSTYLTLLRRTLERWDKAYVTSATTRTANKYRALSVKKRCVTSINPSPKLNIPT